jgi:hypothetical protein
MTAVIQMMRKLQCGVTITQLIIGIITIEMR